MIPEDEARIRAVGEESLVKVIQGITKEIFEHMDSPLKTKKAKLDIKRDDLNFILSYFQVPELDDICCTLKTKDLSFETLTNYIAENIGYIDRLVADEAEEQAYALSLP